MTTLEISVLTLTKRGAFHDDTPHLFFGAQIAIEHQLRINDEGAAIATVQRLPVRGTLPVYIVYVPGIDSEVYTDRHEAHQRYEVYCKLFENVELLETTLNTQQNQNGVVL